MNSKIFLLLFLIATFLTVLSFDKSLKPSKHLKWTPVKYTNSKMIYSFAQTAARTYFLKLRKRDPNDIEVCQVTNVVQNRKNYKITFIAKATDCKRKDIEKDCWQLLHADINR